MGVPALSKGTAAAAFCTLTPGIARELVSRGSSVMDRVEPDRVQCSHNPDRQRSAFAALIRTALSRTILPDCPVSRRLFGRCVHLTHERTSCDLTPNGRPAR